MMPMEALAGMKDVFKEIKRSEIGGMAENKMYTKVVEKLDVKIKIERHELLPKTGGEWTGKPGESVWKPFSDVVPGDRNGTNPEHKTWEKIMSVHEGSEGIPFKKGEPDFSEFAKGKVDIKDFSDSRDANFAQADEKLAQQRGCSPEEVAKWREENRYTWHECSNCRTMLMVPSEVHGNVPHSGGISAYKQKIA